MDVSCSKVVQLFCSLSVLALTFDRLHQSLVLPFRKNNYVGVYQHNKVRHSIGWLYCQCARFKTFVLWLHMRALRQWMEMTETEIVCGEKQLSEGEAECGVQEGKRLGGAWEVRRGSGNERRRDWRWGKMRHKERGSRLCVNGSCRSLLWAAPHWPARVPPVWRKYHQGNFVSLPLCMFSSLPGLFLNSIRLPAQTEDYKPQHPCFVVFRICQFTNQEKAAAMFSSSPLPQLHCKLFAKMGDDRPFVCNAPGCGQVSLLPLCPRFQVCVCVCVCCGVFLPLCKCSPTVDCNFLWLNAFTFKRKWTESPVLLEKTWFE